MHRTMLTDQHWLKLKSIAYNFRIYLKHNLRSFIESILYRIRTSYPWRNIPESFGKSNRIFKWFTRWFKDNKLLKYLSYFQNMLIYNGCLLMLAILEYINMLQDSRIKLFQEATVETVLKSIRL